MEITKEEVENIFNDETGQKFLEYILKFDKNNMFTYKNKTNIDVDNIKLTALNEACETILEYITQKEIDLSTMDFVELVKNRKVLKTEYPHSNNPIYDKTEE